MTLDTKVTKSSMEVANIQRKKSENYLRTGLLKWKPHFKKAGDGFCKAALLYCEAGDLQGGVAMLIKASESYKCKRMWTSGAKTLEHAINLSIDSGDTSCIVDLAWKSAALYKKAGHPDCAAQVLERAGQALKTTSPEKNLMLLEKAAETVETENRPLHAAFYVKKLLSTALEKKEFQYAISKAKQLIQLYQESGQTSQTGNYVLILVLINIVVQDIDKANLSASEFCNYCSLAQSKAMDDLIEGFEASDYSQVSGALNSETIECLLPVFEGLVKDVWIHAEKLKTIETSEKDPADAKDHMPPSDDPKGPSGPDSSQVMKKLKSAFLNEGRLGAQGPPQTSLPSKQPLSEPRKRPVLLKRATVAQMDNGVISSKLEFGGMAESTKKNALSRVKSVGPYFDVLGVDVVSPSQLGMTNDQWRELKKSRINELHENDIDSC